MVLHHSETESGQIKPHKQMNHMITSTANVRSTAAVLSVKDCILNYMCLSCD